MQCNSKRSLRNVLVAESMPVCVCAYSLCGGKRERSKTDLSADEKVKRAFYLTQLYADQVRTQNQGKLINEEAMNSMLK